MTRNVLVGLAFAVILAAGPALADDVTGTWLRDTGASKVKFSRCGDTICGNLVWLKDGADP